MADDRLRDEVAELSQTLQWAQAIRSDPSMPTVALQLSDELIDQTLRLLTVTQEQLDRCNVEATS